MPEARRPSIVTDLPGPRARAVLADSRAFEPSCMSDQQPLVWDHAEDVWITDVDGNVFLDFCAGVLVANIGHSHPRYVAAVTQQARRLCSCYDFPTAERAALARKLVEISASHLERAFILTTGSEAVEAAMKMVRRASGRHEILAFGGAFHGRTYGAMSLGGNVGVRAGFGPVVPGILRAPFPYCYRCPLRQKPDTCDLACIDHLDYVVKTQSCGDLGALVTEPYQGGAGSIIPPPGWFERLEEWRKSKGLLFILDEVQSSFGRTGTLFAYEHWPIQPDAVTLGKGLASGVPCSAVLTTEALVADLEPGDLSSTSGGNPLSAAAALASIDIIVLENLAENARKLGETMDAAFREMMDRAPKLGDVRGMGLAYALEMVDSRDTKAPSPAAAKRVVEESFRRGLALIAPIGFHGNVIRIAPPLSIGEDALKIGLGIIDEALAVA